VDDHVEQDLNIPRVLPLLPVRDVVVFPYMIIPLFVGRESSILSVNEAMQASEDRWIFLAAQRDHKAEEPGPQEIHEIGTIANIMKMKKIPDGRVKILIQGMRKGRIVRYASTEPYYSVEVEELHESMISDMTLEVEAMIRSVKENLEQIISLGKVLSPEILMFLEEVHEPGRLADMVASNMGLKMEESQQILEIFDPIQRLQRINDLLAKEIELLQMQARIQSQAKEEMGRTQREYFLKEQLRAIQSELGDLDPKAEEIEDLRKRIAEARMPKDAEAEALKQVKRLDQMHPDSSEANMTRTYVDWLCELPWSQATEDVIDIQQAKRVLDEDHYDLERIKERILEFLGVRKLKADTKGPIICFVGPPGVGKTSLGKSIARAMGRKFVRISLGGVKDEAEIRGHRRTYVGAMPGKIIQGLKQAGSNNPVFMLDEVDKIGLDFRGDPSSALLEVLDPEQNSSFRDHYINLDFDLRNVMFIATANLIDPIPPALKDRMEIIRLSGYSEEEKLQIAFDFLIPKQLEENGLTKDNIYFSKGSVRHIISAYTREPGLRNLERQIAKCCRKIARQIAEGKKGKTNVTETRLTKYLGPPWHQGDLDSKEPRIGVATGLAWTQVGGEVMYIEATKYKGKGNLTLTGQLGDVMKESAHAAFSYARSRTTVYEIEEDIFSAIDIHIHVPAGATPKDGPSAGVTLATALFSLLLDIPVRNDVAMTGEITLSGQILPIGGLKEKVLAALRLGLTKVIIPEKNRFDLIDIPRHIQRRIDFILVKGIDDVLDNALVTPPTRNPEKKRQSQLQTHKTKALSPRAAMQ